MTCSGIGKVRRGHRPLSIQRLHRFYHLGLCSFFELVPWITSAFCPGLKHTGEGVLPVETQQSAKFAPSIIADLPTLCSPHPPENIGGSQLETCGHRLGQVGPRVIPSLWQCLVPEGHGSHSGR